MTNFLLVVRNFQCSFFQFINKYSIKYIKKFEYTYPHFMHHLRHNQARVIQTQSRLDQVHQENGIFSYTVLWSFVEIM